MTADGLAPLLSPTSIAVIGASGRPESVGYRLFANILLNRFTGTVYPVNPNRKSVLGVKCYPTVLDVPDDLDLAIIIVPNRMVPGVMEECGRKGVKASIVISAGFREVGAAGAELEERLRQVASSYGIRVVGPNCFGIINTDPRVSLNATFSRSMPPAGNISFISQSGALGSAIIDYAVEESIGFSKFVSMGNKADVDENDLLLALGDDPQTKVILLYVEDLADGREFIRIAREVSDQKPILAIKAGRTPGGARAALSHTGALAGSDKVYDAVFAQSGVLRVDTMEELFDCAEAFSKQPLPKGRGVAVITNGGGPGIIAADACERAGLTLVKLQDETVTELRGFLPPAASAANPIDLVAEADHQLYRRAIRTVLGDASVDALIVMLTPLQEAAVVDVANAIVEATRGAAKPVLSCFVGVVDITRGVRILQENGIPHYTFPEAPGRVLARMHEYAEWVERPRTEVRVFQVDKARASEVFRRAVRENRNHIPDFEAMEVLRAYGFPVLRFELARSVSDAVAAAERIGYPVAMKIASTDVVHKFDVGGLRLNIRDSDEARQAYEEIISGVRARVPKARVLGVTVQEMIFGGKEVILGITRDPRFGPLLMFGLGGIYVEVFGDVTFRLAPVREYGAYRMIRSTAAYRLLEGVRGEPPSDIGAVAECIQRLSQLATDFPLIRELDINPLTVFPQGEGCRVVDARIIID